MSVNRVEALDKVFELAVRVGDDMRTELSRRGLTAARAEVLLVLHAVERPLVQRELSQALRCTPRHVTTLVDALEAQGLVARRPHPRDRRATLVTLTEQGRAAADRMNRERHAAAHAMLGDLPDAVLAGFLTVADRVLDRLGQPATADRTPEPDAQAVPRAPVP